MSNWKEGKEGRRPNQSAENSWDGVETAARQDAPGAEDEVGERRRRCVARGGGVEGGAGGRWAALGSSSPQASTFAPFLGWGQVALDS